MSRDVVSQQPIEIFISYSRKDMAYADELRKHLKIYERSGLIRVWYDGNVKAGDYWEDEICREFCSASIILLLVSPDFFDSEYCIDFELPKALQRAQDDDAKVVPIIIRDVEWKRTELSSLNVLPSNSLPITKWDCKDEFYRSVTRSLFEEVDAALGVGNAGERRSRHIWGTEPVADTGKTAPDRRGPTGNKGPENRASRPSDAPSFEQSVLSTPAEQPLTAPAVDGPAHFRSEVHGLVSEIVVCFLHPERLDKLRELRKWCRDTGDPLVGENAARVKYCPTLEEAVQRVTDNATESLLLLDGFEPGTPQLDELLCPGEGQRPLNVIINAPEWEDFAPQNASASILQSVSAVTSDETLKPALRKALLRIRTRNFATARVLETEEELESFFRLRYRVWSQLGYLAEAKRCPETPWELDFTDRTSEPLGIFSNLDGTLIGGARLVSGLGEEHPTLIRTISAMLQKQDSPVIQGNFEYPTVKTQPFDILGELHRFKEYYRDLVRSGVRKAELSRVVVAPEYRQLGLGEILVDTMCSLAKMRAIEVLFLACHSRHAEFYERSHFNVVNGVSGDSFLTYRVPCIAMDRRFFETT